MKMDSIDSYFLHTHAKSKFDNLPRVLLHDILKLEHFPNSSETAAHNSPSSCDIIHSQKRLPNFPEPYNNAQIYKQNRVDPHKFMVLGPVLKRLDTHSPIGITYLWQNEKEKPASNTSNLNSKRTKNLLSKNLQVNIQNIQDDTSVLNNTRVLRSSKRKPNELITSITCNTNPGKDAKQTSNNNNCNISLQKKNPLKRKHTQSDDCNKKKPIAMIKRLSISLPPCTKLSCDLLVVNDFEDQSILRRSQRIRNKGLSTRCQNTYDSFHNNKLRNTFSCRADKNLDVCNENENQISRNDNKNHPKPNSVSTSSSNHKRQTEMVDLKLSALPDKKRSTRKITKSNNRSRRKKTEITQNKISSTGISPPETEMLKGNVNKTKNIFGDSAHKEIQNEQNEPLNVCTKQSEKRRNEPRNISQKFYKETNENELTKKPEKRNISQKNYKETDENELTKNSKEIENEPRNISQKNYKETNENELTKKFEKRNISRKNYKETDENELTKNSKEIENEQRNISKKNYKEANENELTKKPEKRRYERRNISPKNYKETDENELTKNSKEIENESSSVSRNNSEDEENESENIFMKNYDKNYKNEAKSISRKTSQKNKVNNLRNMSRKKENDKICQPEEGSTKNSGESKENEQRNKSRTKSKNSGGDEPGTISNINSEENETKKKSQEKGNKPKNKCRKKPVDDKENETEPQNQSKVKDTNTKRNNPNQLQGKRGTLRYMKNQQKFFQECHEYESDVDIFDSSFGERNKRTNGLSMLLELDPNETLSIKTPKDKLKKGESFKFTPRSGLLSEMGNKVTTPRYAVTPQTSAKLEQKQALNVLFRHLQDKKPKKRKGKTPNLVASSPICPLIRKYNLELPSFPEAPLRDADSSFDDYFNTSP